MCKLAQQCGGGGMDGLTDACDSVTWDSEGKLGLSLNCGNSIKYSSLSWPASVCCEALRKQTSNTVSWSE